MEKVEILEKVRTLVSNRLEINFQSIGSESRLKEDLGMDSLDRLELLYASEEEFNIRLNDTAFDGCQTISEAVDIIAKSMY